MTLTILFSSLNILFQKFGRRLLHCLLFICLYCSCNLQNEGPNFIEYPTQSYLVNPSLSQSEDSINSKPIKIIVWSDSVGCTGCKIQLDTWEYIIKELNQAFPNEIDYIFFLQFERLEELEYILGISANNSFMENSYTIDGEESDEYDLEEIQLEILKYPIYWDPNGDFGRINQTKGYKCFIVDSINHVNLQSDPPFIPSTRALYKQVIKKILEKEKNIRNSVDILL